MNWRRLILVAAALFVPAAARAGSTLPRCVLPKILVDPFAWLTVNGQCFDLSSSITPTTPGKIWDLNTTISLPDAVIRLTATYNADPFITFGATTTNLTAGPTTYAFLFGTPIVPGFYNTASSTGGVTVTTAGGTAMVDNSGVYPTYVSGYGTLGLAATNLGVDLGTGPCSVTAGGVATNTCNYGTTTNTFAPAFYDNLEALLTYTQSGSSSVASWSGAVSLSATAVPEPMTLGLVLIGLAGVGAVRALRRRSA